MMHEKLLQHYFEQENSEGDLSPEQWETVLGHVKTQKQRRSSWGLLAPLTARGAVPAIAATLVLAITAGVISLWVTAPWDGSSANGPSSGWGHIGGLPGHPAPQFFERVWKADRSLIAPGEPVVVTLTLKNVWDKPLRIIEFPATLRLTPVDTHREGAEEPIFVALVDDGNPANSLEPGQELAFVANVQPQVSAGLQSGRYGFLFDFRFDKAPDGPEVAEVRTSSNSGILFVVLPPEGALDKTILVDQIREANGVTITFEKIHFTPEKTTIAVVALAAPSPGESARSEPAIASTPTPVFPSQGYPTPVPAPTGGDVSLLAARYQINGGAWYKLVGEHSYRETPNGLHHEWTFGPVSANSSTFVLAIMSGSRPGSTRLGEWIVPLKGNGQD